MMFILYVKQNQWVMTRFCFFDFLHSLINTNLVILILIESLIIIIGSMFDYALLILC